uniref:Lipoprotein n=1 Tax=Caulobacter sp. (strain K31) TaxID=366602 RepID=B0T6H9_CAUSK
MKNPVLGVAVASTLLSACATVSFAPPETTKSAKIEPTSIALAVGKIGAREKEYAEAADHVANAPQVLDIPILAGGIVGLNAAVIGKHQHLIKKAAVFVTGGLALRDYYKFGDRHDVLVSASLALFCVQKTAHGLAKLDPIEGAGRWDQANNWAAANSDDEAAKAIRKYAPTVLHAPARFDYAIAEIDTLARKRLKTPTAPDPSGFVAKFQANVAKIQESSAGNDETLKALGGMRGFVAGGGGETYKALLADKELLDAITGLEVQLDACRSLLGG